MSKKANVDTEDRLVIAWGWEGEIGMEIKSDSLSFGGDENYCGCIAL